MRTGPILLIEDDEDDQYLVQKILHELGVANPIRFFTNGQQVLDYLTGTPEQPFLILCDINMPLMSGIELRRHIEEDEILKKKAIPFVFLTTDASAELVQEAYGLTIQGFFKKVDGYQAAKEQLQWIVGYWRHCLHLHNQYQSE